MRRRLGWLAVVGVAVALTVVATWLAFDLLLGEADEAGSAQRPAARIDAIRTGLTVAAGAGALFALGLAPRRQWYTEHDSRERRITELYVQSVEQLGSERAPVRLTAQRLLAKHLVHGAPTSWPGMNLDLSGATLVGFNLLHCRVGFANFNRARFTGRQANFYSTVFTDGVPRRHFLEGSCGRPVRVAHHAWRAGRRVQGGESDAVDGDRIESVGE